ncbi:Electron transfer flavoprotein alpha-subunit, partial [Coemansia sp. RSA 1836]
MLGSVRCALARSSILKQVRLQLLLPTEPTGTHSLGRLYAAQRSCLSSLVFVETKGSGFDEGALNAITAARKLSGPVVAVVAGSEADAVAKSIAKIEGVDKVVVAKNAAYDHALPETTASLLKALQEKEG